MARCRSFCERLGQRTGMCFFFFNLLLISFFYTVVAAKLDLPIGEINVLVLTDTHSWVAGHGPKDELLNADYGDVVSFYELLRGQVAQLEELKHRNLFFVMNGDWVDGTGMSMNGDVYTLTQILERMPWDAVNVGNHELYHENLVDFVQRPGGFVDWWNGGYLTSNIVNDNQEPLGSRYRVLRGPSATVLTFGFLYNMKDHVQNVDVHEVEFVVDNPWFKSILHADEYDAILVLAHMDVKDPLVTVILNKIRSELGDDMPVQFITGHTHIRSFAEVDYASTSFEAGRYLDTLGFVSFPTKATLKEREDTVLSQDLFKHKYLDANVDVFRQTLGVESLETYDGAALSSLIFTARQKMGLTEHIGCADQTYYVDKSTFETNSLWALFNRSVVPTQFKRNEMIFLSKGSWRYDLAEGALAVGDVVAVSPFNDSFVAWDNVPGSVIDAMNRSLNAGTESWLPKLPSYILSSTVPLDTSQNVSYNLVTGIYESNRIAEAMKDIYPSGAKRTPRSMEVTSTSLWLEFFRHHSPCHDKFKPSHGRPKLPHQLPWRRNDPGKSGGSSTHASDGVRVTFVFFACLSVVASLSIHVYQQRRIVYQTLAARERATREALEEYSQSRDGTYQDNFVIDEDSEDEENGVMVHSIT